MKDVGINKKVLIGIIVLVIAVAGLCFFLLRGGNKKEYTVTFNSDGGSIINSIKVKENEKVEKPEDPTKEGYDFAGWYYEEELFDFNTKINKDIILVAHWNSNGIELDNKNIDLTVGEEKEIDIKSLPDGIKIEDLEFTSSDESIVTILENGKIKGLKTGSVTITIKSKDGKYSVNCIVTVKEEEKVVINGESSVTVGNSIQLTASLEPSNVLNQKFTWESSNSGIATVDENGKVTGVSAGKVTITATASNGKSATKDITVNAKAQSTGGSSGSTKPSKPSTPTTIDVTSITINGSKEVYAKESIQLYATVYPDNATNKNVTWQSSNSGIATVDASGKVTGVNGGNVTITATASNGVSATYEITVKDKYVIYLTQRALELVTGGLQYDFRVEKNGSPFDDYLGFTFNGTQIAKDQGSVASTVVEKGGNEATLRLANKTNVTASVVIN